MIALGLIGGLLVSSTPVQAGPLLDSALQRAKETRFLTVATQPAAQPSCAAAASAGTTDGRQRQSSVGWFVGGIFLPVIMPIVAHVTTPQAAGRHGPAIQWRRCALLLGWVQRRSQRETKEGRVDRKRYRDWPVCRTGGHSRRRLLQVLNAEKLSLAREIHTRLINGLDEFPRRRRFTSARLSRHDGPATAPHARSRLGVRAASPLGVQRRERRVERRRGKWGVLR